MLGILWLICWVSTPNDHKCAVTLFLYRPASHSRFHARTREGSQDTTHRIFRKAQTVQLIHVRKLHHFQGHCYAVWWTVVHLRERSICTIERSMRGGWKRIQNVDLRVAMLCAKIYTASPLQLLSLLFSSIRLRHRRSFYLHWSFPISL
jgi:hypothetical protein